MKDFEAQIAAQEAKKAAFEARTEARTRVLFLFGVTMEPSFLAGHWTLQGGISDDRDRLARLDFSSYEGWKVATSSSIWGEAKFNQMLAEMQECRRALDMLRAIGEQIAE